MAACYSAMPENLREWERQDCRGIISVVGSKHIGCYKRMRCKLASSKWYRLSELEF